MNEMSKIDTAAAQPANGIDPAEAASRIVSAVEANQREIIVAEGMEEAIISGVTHNEKEVVFTLTGIPDRPGAAATVFDAVAKHGVNVDTILQNVVHGVAELSFSNYMALRSRGQCPYIAIPVFPGRKFRHSAIYIRTDRGIKTAADLKGKKVGVPAMRLVS